MARTELELATNVLRSLNVVDAMESGSAADTLYVMERYRDVHAELADDSYRLAYWPIDQIPSHIFEPLTNLIALSVAPAFGIPAMAENVDAARKTVLQRIRRHSQVRSAEMPGTYEDF